MILTNQHTFLADVISFPFELWYFTGISDLLNSHFPTVTKRKSKIRTDQFNMEVSTKCKA